MADLTFEDAKFIDMLVMVFLKQLDLTESFVQGVDVSDAKIAALALRKKVRSIQPPKQEKPNAEAKANDPGTGKEPAPEAATPAAGSDPGKAA